MWQNNIAPGDLAPPLKPRSQTTLRSTALAFGVYISSAAYWKPYAEVPCPSGKIWSYPLVSSAKIKRR